MKAEGMDMMQYRGKMASVIPLRNSRNKKMLGFTEGQIKK